MSNTPFSVESITNFLNGGSVELPASDQKNNSEPNLTNLFSEKPTAVNGATENKSIYAEEIRKKIAAGEIVPPTFDDILSNVFDKTPLKTIKTQKQVITESAKPKKVNNAGLADKDNAIDAIKILIKKHHLKIDDIFNISCD